MPDPSRWGLFALATLALLVVPGPAVLYIVARSIEQGRRGGVLSVLGIHTGTLVHVAAASVGLSAILVQSATAFTVVKLAGAVYLVVIGLRRLLRPAVSDDDVPRKRSRHVYWQGVVVNVLNPKTAVFFFAFLPQFARTKSEIVVLGATFVVLGVLSDGAYALLAGTLGPRLSGGRAAQRLRERISGAFCVALGLVTAKA